MKKHPAPGPTARWQPTPARVLAGTVMQAAIAPARAPSQTESPPGLRPTTAQQEVLQFARRALERRRCVLVAERVGTGKSIIGLQLIAEELRRGGQVLLTTPAALGAQWKRLLAKLDHQGWTWLSHTRLSTGRFSTPAPLTLVVTDEAHGFRNPATRRYRALARLCAGSKVVLLTATPINNSMMDLYFQLRLGLGDGALADLGVPDLALAFREGTARGSAGATLRRALREVVLRRSGHHRTLDAVSDDANGADRLRFPRRAPPVAVRHATDARFHCWLDVILRLSFDAFGAGRSGGPPRALLQLMLVKRLQSSAAALRATVGGLLRFHDLFLEALAAGRLLRPAAARSPSSDDRAQQLVFAELLGEPLPLRVDARRLGERVTRDRTALATLLGELRAPGTDPKLIAMRALLDGTLAGCRILLFTEFRETAAWLAAELARPGGVARIDGGGAWLGRSRASRADVVRRFAPLSNGAAPPPPHEVVRLLIATDVLSEGMNLQDADTVVNYDLPWNPVRLIQRVGRVDRMGSPHASVSCYNFMPDQRMDEFIRVVARLAAKLGHIRSGLGEADPVLDADAGPDPAFLDRLQRGDASVFEARLPSDLDLPSILLQDPGLASRPPSSPPQALAGADPSAIPVASVNASPNLAGGSMVVGVEDMGLVRLFAVRRGRVRELEARRAADLIRCALGEPSGAVRVTARCRRRLDASVAAVQDTIAGAQRRLHGASSSGTLVRLLRRRMSAVTEPALLVRADALARRIAVGLTSGEDACLRVALRAQTAEQAVPEMLAAAEQCLGSPRTTDIPRVLGVFVITAAVRHSPQPTHPRA